MRSFPPVAIGARRQTVLLRRTIPMKGDVMVGYGRRVRPGELVARGEAVDQPFAVWIPDLVPPDGKDSTVRLNKQLGDKVVEGECLASRKGFLGREKGICPSPGDGWVAIIDNDRSCVIVTPSPRQVELVAGVDGTVVEVIAGRGVVLAVNALYGQGVVMAGEDLWGPLRVDHTWGPERAGVSLENQVVLANVLGEAELETAAKAGARALIAGSASRAGWRGLREGRWPGLSVLLTEGIGDAPMSEGIYRELSRVGGSAVLLVNKNGRFGDTGRPEFVVSLPGEDLAGREPPRLEPGATARVVAGLAAGQTGTVVDLPSGPPSSKTGRGNARATIALASGERVAVVVSNLEVLG